MPVAIAINLLLSWLIFEISVSFGLPVAGIALAFLVLVIAKATKFLRWGFAQVQMYHYANMTKWIIESSQHPNDRKVYKRAQKHRQLLSESGNHFGVRVFEIVYNPHIESWEEFSMPGGRRDMETREIMRKWNSYMFHDLNGSKATDEERTEFHYRINLNQEV